MLTLILLNLCFIAFIYKFYLFVVARPDNFPPGMNSNIISEVKVAHVRINRKQTKKLTTFDWFRSNLYMICSTFLQ